MSNTYHIENYKIEIKCLKKKLRKYEKALSILLKKEAKGE